MNTDNVTPIGAVTKGQVRTRNAKAAVPDVSLLSEAATLIAFAHTVYDQAETDDLHGVVKVVRSQIERWVAEHPNLCFSDEVYQGLSLVIMVDSAWEAELPHPGSLICEPYRNTLNVAAGVLEQAALKPTRD
jgi:hypothetical protein